MDIAIVLRQRTLGSKGSLILGPKPRMSGYQNDKRSETHSAMWWLLEGTAHRIHRCSSPALDERVSTVPSADVVADSITGSPLGSNAPVPLVSLTNQG